MLDSIGLFEKDPIKLEECLLLEFWINPDPTITAETNFSNPDIRPNKFDQTFDGWLGRIGTWGKVNFLHKDPENRRKDTLSQSKFLDRISTTELLKVYGKFRIELRAINELDFIKSYVGMDGKEYEEVFKVKVDLKPNLRKGLHFWDGLFG